MSVVGFDEDQSGLQVIMAEGLRPFSGYLVVPLMQAMSGKCLTWARDLEPCCRTAIGVIRLFPIAFLYTMGS